MSATPFRTNISVENPRRVGSGDTYDDNLDLDVLIVGAGFGGCYLLHRMRDELGLKVGADAYAVIKASDVMVAVD